MKKTQTVNIGGIAFTMDEDAYQILCKYLETIEKRYLHRSERKEIMEDIEARIAEIFKEKMKTPSQVIRLVDVEDLKKIIGEPDDFVSSEPEYEDTHESEETRRVYRDPDNRILGGVCSGLAYHFNIDPSLMRILFLIAFILFGIGFFIYIILWIIIPEAYTSLKKDDMKGKTFDSRQMKDFVKNEYEQVKRNFNRKFNTTSA